MSKSNEQGGKKRIIEVTEERDKTQTGRICGSENRRKEERLQKQND